MTVTARRAGPKATIALGPFGLHEMYTMYAGVTVPDPITFVIGEDWLNRPNLYPRQATLLKIIFLRDDLMTEYDKAVIGMWEEQYRQTGYNGLVPNIMWRITWLKASGAKWFREVLLVMGRRAGKGHVTALAMAYVLWTYLAKGDPQKFYGIDRAKRLTAIVFAGKRDQAKATVFADLVGIITGSECFLPYVSVTQTERLSIYAPHDFIKMRRLVEKGIHTERDQATFEILPKESTTMAGRGSTTFGLVFDEFAHLVAAGTSRGSEDLYKSSKPSTDQFRQDAFIIQPSSPWQMSGQFFTNYNEAISLDEDGHPVRPNYLMLQLASWDIYLDYQQSPRIPLFPTGFVGDLGEYADRVLPRLPVIDHAMQVFDDEMRREKQSNPETFAVEREARFATSLDAYLDERLVMKIFQPWLGRPERYGTPSIKEQVRGVLTYDYKGHADPSKVNDKFGFALAHVEVDAEGRHHAVFDRIGAFDPADFPDHTIDYEQVEDWLWDHLVSKFCPGEFTFDQYNSVASIQKMQKRVRAAKLPKRVEIFEKTSTRPYDWRTKEATKAAINLGLVHAPPNADAELELRFLQLVNGRVDHPSTGPVTTKDIADCMCECVAVLIGEQTQNFLHPDLSIGASFGGLPSPFAQEMGGTGSMSREDEAVIGAMGVARAKGARTPRDARNSGRRVRP